MAIIVILAIIAVITVPIILNVIDSTGKLVNSNGVVLNTTISGTVPTEGWVQLDKGNVIAYSLMFDDYVVTKYQDTEASAVKNGEIAENVEAREARLESERQTRAIETAKGIASSQTGTTEIKDITDGWVAFINGELKAYSIKVTEGDYTYVVTDLDVDSSNSHAVADRTTSDLASKASAEQAIVSTKVDSYVKAALTANSSLNDETVKEVSEMSGVTTNPADSGWIHFNKVNNSVVVVDYSLTYGDLTANYSSLTDGNYLSTFGSVRNKPSILSGTTKADGAKYLTTVQEVYYNPVSGAKNCNGQEGCMHWYLYSVKGDYANMILDHNITDAQAASGVWASENDYKAGLTEIKDENQTVTGYQTGEGTGSKATSAGITYPNTVTSFGLYSSNKNKRGPVTALNTLKSLTSGWTATQTPKVPNSTSTDEHIIPASANNNQYQIDYTGYHARLITYTEAGYLGCTTNSNSCPEWMKDNIYSNQAPYGYWTSSPRAGNSLSAWSVSSNRRLSSGIAGDTYPGVRPVITVSTSDVF